LVIDTREQFKANRGGFCGVLGCAMARFQSRLRSLRKFTLQTSPNRYKSYHKNMWPGKVESWKQCVNWRFELVAAPIRARSVVLHTIFISFWLIYEGGLREPQSGQIGSFGRGQKLQTSVSPVFLCTLIPAFYFSEQQLSLSRNSSRLFTALFHLAEPHVALAIQHVT